MRIDRTGSLGRRWRLSLAWVAVLSGGGLLPRVAAQPTGYGAAPNVANGFQLLTSSPGYNTAAETFLVNATFTLKPGELPANYTFLIQGRVVGVASLGANVFVGSLPVPMGPTTPPGGWGIWAYGGILADQDRIAKPLVAELVRNSDGAVVGRGRVLIWDKRSNSQINPQQGGGRIPGSLGMEITRSGLNRLQAVHTSLLPHPSVTAFGTTITSQFQGLVRSVLMDTGVSSATKACMPLDSVPREFQSLPEFAAILAEATLGYGLYQWAVANSIGLANLAKFCVRDAPVAADFEVCASSLRGVSSTATLFGAAGTNLDLGAANVSPPQLTAQTTAGRLKGDVNGTLQVLFLRYAKRANSACTLRPRLTIAESSLTPSTALTNWRTCSPLSITVASSPMGGAVSYALDGDTDPEVNRVNVYTAPSPLFSLGAVRSKQTAVGTCAGTGFQVKASQLLDSYWPRLESALNAAWTAGTPRTHEANALDQIFSRWETGVWGDTGLGDHQLFQDYSPGSSLNLSDRFYTRLNTEAKAIGGLPGGPWVYAPPETFPCATSSFVCMPGRSYWGQPFDVSYTVTTGAFNQVIKELSTQQLNFNFQPTWAQLGAPPPPGVSPDTPAILNGGNLSYLNPAFLSLGGGATITVRPSVNPFTYINPEPVSTGVPITVGRHVMSYSLPGLVVEVRGANPSPLADNTLWLSLFIDVHDRNFQMTPSTTANVLIPAYSGTENSRITVMANGFHNTCNMGTVINAGCAEGVGSSLAQILLPVVKQKLQFMLSRFPFPVKIDAGGSAPVTRTFQFGDTYKWANLITYYGTLQ